MFIYFIYCNSILAYEKEVKIRVEQMFVVLNIAPVVNLNSIQIIDVLAHFQRGGVREASQMWSQPDKGVR